MIRVKKAVFPVAGLGTRFLPATKAMPKELLPIIDKPIVQFAVEEAVAAGITDLIFVTGRSKRAIEDHFDANLELEFQLEARGKSAERALVRNILPPGVNLIIVRQPEPRGLGDAVLCAEPAVGDEPFAVLLADDLMLGGPLPTAQLIRAFDDLRMNVLSVAEVHEHEVSKFGIVRPSHPPKTESTFVKPVIPVAGLVEKPLPQEAPSRLASLGRYVFHPEIFEVLRGLPPGAGGEIQLADAIDILARRGRVIALSCQARRYDCGSKLGYLTAILDHALADPCYREAALAFLRDRLGVGEQTAAKRL